MILVTGTGRCGTSLMMQTLHYLGIPTIGDPWDEDSGLDGDEQDLIQFADRISELNPKGYWEKPLDDIVLLCQEGLGHYKGKAMKICCGLTQEINADDIEKMIICNREDKLAQATSMLKLGTLGLEMQAYNKEKEGNFGWYKDKDVYDVLLEQEMWTIIINNLSSDYNIPTIDICFEDMLNDPEGEIKSLVRFLDIDVDITEAVNNVDKR